MITVIIPTYNRRYLLQGAIESVLQQTCERFELIVVDDGSTDDTASMVESINDSRVSYFFKEHSGVSAARNTGIKLSVAPVVAFLDSDDRWTEKKLERAVEYISAYPGKSIFHTEEVWYRNGSLLSQKRKHRKPSGYIYSKCVPICCIGMSTAVVKRGVFDRIGYFDEQLPACEDYDFWLRACSVFDVELIPEALTIKHGGRTDQLSRQPGLDRYRVLALEKMVCSDNLTYEQKLLTTRELLRRCDIYARGAEKRGRIMESSVYIEKIGKYRSLFPELG